MKSLNVGIQESLVALLCFDDSAKGAKLVRTLVPAGAYDPYYREFAMEAITYLDRYGKAPGEHTLDIAEALGVRKPEAKEIYDKVYASLVRTKDGVNADYVIDQAQKFARRQAIRAGIAKALDSLESDTEGSLDEAEGALAASMRQTVQLFTPGTDFSIPEEALRFLDVPLDDLYFPTGIPELDRYDAGPRRKGLHLFVGLQNRGKTWWLVNLGRTARMNGKRVLHISLEMDEDEVAKRYVQAFHSVTKRKEAVKISRFTRDKLDRFAGLQADEIEDRPAFVDGGIKARLTKNIMRGSRSRPKLYIKQFPTGSLTINQLEAYLDLLEAQRSFIPDLILLDYVDLMEIDPKHQRTMLGKIVQDLRGIGVKRNMAIATVTQSNREGEDAKYVKAKNVSEDFSKMFTADTVLIYSQTEAELTLGLARIVGAKMRGDAKGFAVLISQAYAAGQFCMDSIMMSSNYWQAVDSSREQEEDTDGSN